MKKIFYITNIFPHYRLAIWKELLSSTEFDLEIFFSSKNPLGIYSPDLNSIFNKKELSKIQLIKNFWFKNKILVWQSKIITSILFKKFDYLMILGEMNIISSWIIILIAKIRGKKIFMWSHGIYGNESKLKKYFRVSFLKFADVIFLYENRAKLLLLNEGFNSSGLEVIYNSLNFELHDKLFKKLEASNRTPFNKLFKKNDLPVIIFIGRLTKIKKVDLLIDSTNTLNKRHIRFNLLIVGDGAELSNLQNSYENQINEGWLHFFGSSYDENQTGELLYYSDLCVSPGNIGLTAIHALTFGTPVASHNNFKNQMPEVETIINGQNGFLFKENDYYDLSLKIDKWFIENPKPNKELVRKIIIEKYNPMNQIKIFTKRFKNA